MSGWVGRFLDRFRSTSRGVHEDSAVARIRLDIQEGCVRIHFQPLVDLKTHAIFAHEGLLRTTSQRFPGGAPAMFKAAVDAGIGGEFGRMLRNITVEACSDTALFININPNEFAEGWLVRPDDPIFWHPEEIYLEITESVPLSHFELCHSVLKEIRSKGCKLAVDDLGAGFSNLKYISDLTPEVVKIDRGLIAGVTEGTRQHRLLRQLIRLCREMGARVVVEGIETVDELRLTIDAGADYGQGYLLCRPAFPPPTTIQWPEGV